MNVNQHTPMTSQYGQPHPGYGQPSYTPVDGGFPAPYAPYNGPATVYQPGAPPQGKKLLCQFACEWVERMSCNAFHSELQPLCVLRPACWHVHVCVRAAVCILIWISTFFSILPFCFVHFLNSPCVWHLSCFLVFQVTLLSQAFPLRLWLPTQSLTSPLLLS